MKILIVDDHAVIHEGLQRIFTDRFKGVVFGDARNPQQALDLTGTEPWDVVILDIGLPGRGGLDLLRTIHAQFPKLPVVVFSMHSEGQFAVQAFKEGASGYITKAMPSAHLVRAIREVLVGGRYVSPNLAVQLVNPFPAVGMQKEF